MAIFLEYENTFLTIKSQSAARRAGSVPAPKRTQMREASEGMREEDQRRRLTARLADAIGMEKPMQQTAAVAQNIGSSHHPELCARPCAHFMAGRCEKEDRCRFCHHTHPGHMLKLDKKQRDLLRRLSQGEVMKFLAQHLRARSLTEGHVDEVERIAAIADEIAGQNLLDAPTDVPASRMRNLSKSFSQLSCAKMIHWTMTNIHISPGLNQMMTQELHKLRREAIFA